MATAVFLWSPVIMTVLMPEVRHLAMASLTSSRGGSIMAISPANVRSASISSESQDRRIRVERPDRDGQHAQGLIREVRVDLG